MVPARRLDGFGPGAEAMPDVGQQPVLRAEGRQLVAAGPAEQVDAFDRLQQRRAFSARFGKIEAERLVDRGAQQRPEVMHAADADHLRDPAGKRRRQRARDHARDQMAAGGVADQADLAVDLAGDDGDEARKFLGDIAHADLGAEAVARHGHGEPVTKRARRQVRPERLVEAAPVAAMAEHDQSPRGSLGQEQVETVPVAIAIGLIEPSAVLTSELGAKFARPGGPIGDLGLDLGQADGGTVVVGLVPVGHRRRLARWHRHQATCFAGGAASAAVPTWAPAGDGGGPIAAATIA